jgi:hypothetical protein
MRPAPRKPGWTPELWATGSIMYIKFRPVKIGGLELGSYSRSQLTCNLSIRRSLMTSDNPGRSERGEPLMGQSYFSYAGRRRWLQAARFENK